MLTSPLRYNFPPLSMRITSRIIKKRSAYAEKIVREKVELQATFFVRLMRSVINLLFLTNQIEGTNKQTKPKRSHGNAVSMENSLELSTTLAYLYQQQPTTGTTTAAVTTTNKSTAATCHLNENQNCDDEDLGNVH